MEEINLFRSLDVTRGSSCKWKSMLLCVFPQFFFILFYHVFGLVVNRSLTLHL